MTEPDISAAAVGANPAPSELPPDILKARNAGRALGQNNLMSQRDANEAMADWFECVTWRKRYATGAALSSSATSDDAAIEAALVEVCGAHWQIHLTDDEQAGARADMRRAIAAYQAAAPEMPK